MANTAQNKDRAAVQSGLNDLLGNVIQNDRQRAGRREPAAQTPAMPEPDAAATPVPPEPSRADPAGAVTQGPPTAASGLSSSDPASLDGGPSGAGTPKIEASDITTDTHSDIMTNGRADGGQPTKTDRPRAERASEAPPTPVIRRRSPAASSPPPASAGSRSSARVEAAEALAETPTMTVTLRIPAGFNEWLDGYVHGSWPQKVRKQELVIEALKLVYARRGKAGEEIIGTALLGEEEGG